MSNLKEKALAYHKYPYPGKLAVRPTKAVASQDALALAYSPGVAHPCHAIAENPQTVFDYTNKGNLVAVISDGSAVLGLGNIGPLASKPVMEGKAILFKHLANVDAYNIEMTPGKPQETADRIAAIAPTFGGINLEDIKAPECFEIEKLLQEKLAIPVFHDDQHGTAIVATAAVLNGLTYAEKTLRNVRCVVSGAGAGALATLKLLESYGLDKRNTFVFDSQGMLHKARINLSRYKAPYAIHEHSFTLSSALKGADIFIGLSGPGLLKAEDIQAMAQNPLILALANPEPEIRPEVARQVRFDATVATGRSDYPNQINNILCFPYLFRGALDVRATKITLGMKKACVQALRQLTPNTQGVSGYTLLPSPLLKDLLWILPVAVAKAAIKDGVALQPLADEKIYIEQLKSLTKGLLNHH